MFNKKLIMKFFSILIIIILILQASFAMPFLSQIWVLDTISRDVEPSLIAPLSECEYVFAGKTGSFKFSELGLRRIYSFIRYRPTPPVFTVLYSRNQRPIPDNREEIRYLIMSHFHGSRYKDASLLLKI